MSTLDNKRLYPVMLLAHGRIPIRTYMDRHRWMLGAFDTWYIHRGRHKHKLEGYHALKVNEYARSQTSAWQAFYHWCNAYTKWLQHQDREAMKRE